MTTAAAPRPVEDEDPFSPVPRESSPEARAQTAEFRAELLSRRQAAQDLSDLTALQACPAWERYARRRMREIRDALGQRVLTEKMTAAERQELHVAYRELDDLLGFPERDESSHQELLSARG